jgi:signal peptidase I
MPTLSLDRVGFAALATEILRGGNTLRFSARGGSMWPIIRNGDWAEVQAISAASIRRGDVVLVRTGSGRLLVHRVRWIGRAGDEVALRTQGDALAHPDPLIHAAQVLGRVVAVERGGRRLRLDRAPLRLAGLAWIRLSTLRRRLGQGLRRWARGPSLEAP